MKKHLFSLGLGLSLLTSSFASALDGQGTVDEIVNCGAEVANAGNYWKQMLLFRLSDDNWFGTYADHVPAPGTTFDYDSNFAVSTVMAAFNRGSSVEVRASDPAQTHCGITASFFWSTPGDYIKIKR